MSLKTDTVSGIKWVFIATVGQKLLGVITTVFLARLLNPSDFGLFALAFVLIDGFGLFKSFGVDAALIRQKERVEEAADTAFCILPFIGLSLSTLLFLVAPVGAAILKNPALTPVVRALSAIFVFSCLAQVPMMLLQKEMLFWKKGLAELTTTLVYSVAAVGLAFGGFGVWSLVYAYLLKTVVHMGMMWVVSSWRPRIRFQKELAVEMLQYGKYILGGSFLFFLKNNVDNVIVGKLLGLSALGFYTLSFGISNFPSTYLIGRMGTVFFPTFSKLQDDDEALRRAFLKSLKLIAMIAIPFGIALVASSPLFLKVVYGEKWLPAKSILRLLAVGGILRALGGSQSPVFLAKGRSKVDFWINVIYVALFFVFIVPFTKAFGLNGAGLVVLISGGVSFMIGMWRVRKVLPVSWKDIFTSLHPALIGSCVMLAIFALLSVGRFFVWHWMTPVSTVGFIVISGLSGIAYLFCIFLLDQDVRLEARRIL
ncbi:MAG: lipopolysaccharide biosynthesis protein [Candidatus Omnitrophica bacterium]|nr:lipopolysaccharide biosynthesis protein [Candidatus Omnitrophota bacterium]